MEKVDTHFMASLLGMRRVGETHFDIKTCSLTHDARNEIAVDAITNDADRVLMIDSDMRFDPDMMERMSARLDEGYDMVCGLFFKRKLPTSPVIYSQLSPPDEDENGNIVPHVVPYVKYPKNTLFEVDGCGFGAVMMTKQLIKDVWDEFGQPPFMPLEWCGEDMSFCYKVRMLNRKIWCDSSIRVGHMGQTEFNEDTYLAQNRNGKG